MGHRRKRRGMAAMAIVVILIIVDLIVLRMVIGGGRDQALTAHRIETVRAFYAAEAGINMAVREIMASASGTDEDGDGAAGTISDDADDATDPMLSSARVVVTSSIDGDETTLTSAGRAGEARRELEVVLE